MLHRQKFSKWSSLITIVLGLLMLLGFISCGAKDQQNPVSGALVHGTTGEGADLLKDERVNCFGSSSCPSSIAKIISIEFGQQNKTCTGFLINNQTMLTAASCIPNDIRKAGPGTSCSGRIFILFPEAKDHKELRVDCGTVERVSANEEINPAFIKNNWAQIKLANSINRETLSVSNEGLIRAPGKKYTSWRVSTETGSGTQSIIKKYECEVIEETYANPLAKGRFYPNTTIGKCYYTDEFGTQKLEEKLYRGNLGAPVIGASGNVVGIIGDDVMSAEEYKQLTGGNFIHVNNQTQAFESLQIMKFTTNLACLPEFVGEYNVPAECTHEYSEEEFRNKRAELLKSSEADGMDTAIDYIKQNNKYDKGRKVEWEITFKPIENGRKEVVYRPRCFEKPDVWLPNEDSLYVKIMTQKLWLKSEADMKVSLSNLAVLIRLNGFLRPEARYEVRKDSEIEHTKSVIEFNLTVKPRKIKDHKSSDTIVRGPEYTLPPLVIPICN